MVFVCAVHKKEIGSACGHKSESRKAGHNSPRLLCAAQLSAPNFNGLQIDPPHRIAVCFSRRVNYGEKHTTTNIK